MMPLYAKIDHNIGFQKNANFSRKLAKSAKISDYNIDTRF
jgi:hypothetical protein